MSQSTDPMAALGRDPQAAALLSDREALEGLLSSPEAQTLARLFQGLGGDGLQQAAQAAAQGDGAALEALVQQVAADPQGAKALEGVRRKAQR